MELHETMDTLKSRVDDGADMSVGAVVDALGRGGVGFFLFLPALVIVLPVSLIPGISSFCALLVLFSASHIFCGRTRLWLPRRIRDIQIDDSRAARVIDKMNGVVLRMEACARPRLGFLTEGAAQKLSLGATALLSLATLVFGFIPLADIVLMTPVIFFGLGFCTGDGLMMAAGWGVLAAAGGLAGYFA